jgi:ferritin-like metal-binding protein YciE
MSQSERKIVQYLGEAHAMEAGLVRELQAQIAMAPRGGYRSALQTHLRETREHARRVRQRLSETRGGGDPLQAVVGLAESTVGQLLALGKAPLALLRGGGSEERVLKAAKEVCASEALEIATYTALEHLARAIGDRTTAELAVSIRQDEERMLARVTRELPKLTGAVVGVEIEGRPYYGLAETGAADAAPTVLRSIDPRRGGEPWPGYDEQTVEQIRRALSDADEQRAKEVRAYERAHKNRSGVLSAAEREAANARV